MNDASGAAPPGHGRIVEIEALRGVAILMVLVEHLPINLFRWYGPYIFFQRYWRGAAGVDLFLVISGFVITRSLAPRLLAAPASRRARVVVAFWIRRFWRLAPAAWLWVVVPVTLSVVFNRSTTFHSPHDNAGPAIAALLNVANFYYALTFPGHDPGITIPYWSLSLEEQFYLLFPFLVLLLRRRLIWLMAALVAYQFVLPDSNLAEVTRPGPIAAGVALAVLSVGPLYAVAAPRFLAQRAWLRRTLLPAGVALAGVLLCRTMTLPHGLKWGCLTVLCASAVFAASFDAGYVLQEGPVRRMLVWVGARSYSLYLVHMGCYAMAQELALRFGLPVYDADAKAVTILLALAAPLTLLAAMGTYRWVETPLRRRGAVYAGRVEGKESMFFFEKKNQKTFAR